jgi:diguanylate cyclase (GGDEF)-like protein
MRLKADQGIAGKVLKTGAAMIVNDTSKDSTFCPDVDRQTGFDTRQVLCVPLVVRGHPIGVVQAINKVSEEPFTEEDLLLFSAFAHQAATVIEQARLHNLATYDALTRVFNRRFFDAWLETEVARVQRNQRSLSLLMLDLDHFKRINDTYGHPSGDAVLTTVGELIKVHLGDNDVPARYGGEELVVGLPDALGEAARDKAELIRKAIELHDFEHGGAHIPVTASIGVATLASGATSGAGQLIREADLALYSAKKTRNRVCCFGEVSGR